MDSGRTDPGGPPCERSAGSRLPWSVPNICLITWDRFCPRPNRCGRVMFISGHKTPNARPATRGTVLVATNDASNSPRRNHLSPLSPPVVQPMPSVTQEMPRPPARPAPPRSSPPLALAPLLRFPRPENGERSRCGQAGARRVASEGKKAGLQGRCTWPKMGASTRVTGQ